MLESLICPDLDSLVVPVVDSVAGDQDWQQEDGRKDQTLKYPLLNRSLHQRGVEHQHISVDHDADSE